MKLAIHHFFYPMWMIKDERPGIIKYLNYFKYINGLTAVDVEKRQMLKLRAILIHAYENTTYYKHIFDQVYFNPYEFRHPSELEKLPLLNKDIIRASFYDMKAKNIPEKDIFKARTGGSTGLPSDFLRDRTCLYLRRGQELYFDSWMNFGIGDKVAQFVSTSHYDGKIDRLKARLRNATCERMLCFDPYSMTDRYMAEYLESYKKFNPKIIRCFPNSLETFAEYLIRKNIKPPKVKSIASTGESLSERQRKMFEDVFGGKVFERYASREAGFIASECRIGKGLHVFSEGVYLEILSETNTSVKPGEIGRVVVTDLFNMAMPRIRYEIGDMAIKSDGRLCPCGVGLPLIEKIIGRDRDMIIDSDGTLKPGYLFMEEVMHMDQNAQFQIVQNEKGSLTVKLVRKMGQPIDLEKIEAVFRKIVGAKLKIDFEFVNEIPRDPSGKYSYVKSNIQVRSIALNQHN